LREPVVEQLRPRLHVALLAEARGVELAAAIRPRADAEHQPAAAEPVERDGLPRQLMRTPARERRHQRASDKPLGVRGDRRHQDPRVGEPSDGRTVVDVVPEEEPVPAARLGADR
jgi:hypothetical protein